MSDGSAVATGMGHALLEARTRWDSTVTADVYVVGDLLLAASKGGRWDVYMADRSDLSRARPLTQDSALESQPVWSPDWRRVAYTVTRHSRSALSDLFVANADGSGPTRLTDDSAMVRTPSFVPPAGEQIVFESSRGAEGWPQLYVIGRNGSGRRQLTRNASSSHPDVSPDGKRVLFVSFRAQNYDVYEMNLDGTGERRLTTDPRPDDSPLYAADGKSFYFLRLEGGRPATKRVYRQDLVPGALSVAVTPAGVFVQTFSVSADGRTLALTVLDPTADGAGSARVELFDVANQGRRPVAIPGLTVLAWPAFRPVVAAP
jgi:Tol biopolymer transport system component